MASASKKYSSVHFNKTINQQRNTQEPMPDASVTDSDGCTIKLHTSRGLVLSGPMGMEKRYEELQEFSAKEDDVLVCGYQKCGTHWVWEIITMLLSENSNYAKKSKGLMMLEADIFPISRIVEAPSPRVLNTHVPFSYLPPDCLKKRCKIVYLLRNPKDVAVSYYNHMRGIIPYGYEGSWNGWLPLYLSGKLELGPYTKYMIQWEKDIKDHPDVPVFSLYYEDLKDDGMPILRQLCKFFGFTRDEGFLNSVLESCSFNKLKAGKESQHGNPGIMRKGTSMYRKGGVGDWKNWFTVAQNEVFDKVYEEETDGLDLKFRYEL